MVNDRQVLLFIVRPKDISNQNDVGLNMVIKNINNIKKKIQNT